MMKGAARGNEKPGREALSVQVLKQTWPELPRILAELGVPVPASRELSLAYLCEEAGVDPSDVFALLETSTGSEEKQRPLPQTVSILPGTDKNGRREKIAPLHCAVGEVIAVVGLTGSGKTRLLSDIEGLVRGDSPSGRSILLDGKAPDDSLRMDRRESPVAQISQGMNYLIDLPVGEFLDMHLESRRTSDAAVVRAAVLKEACSLCGEPFSADTPLVALSGGQARSLMIADALLISRASILLVDEIENAGLDRERALALLFKARAVTIIATHDPLIALMAHRRLVMKNGGISAVVERSAEEEAVLENLKNINSYLARTRAALRTGQSMTAEEP